MDPPNSSRRLERSLDDVCVCVCVCVCHRASGTMNCRIESENNKIGLLVLSVGYDEVMINVGVLMCGVW